VSETVLIRMARPACWIGLGMIEACATCRQASGATREVGRPGRGSEHGNGERVLPGSESVQRARSTCPGTPEGKAVVVLNVTKRGCSRARCCSREPRA
jgi:hypothetical protein